MSEHMRTQWEKEVIKRAVFLWKRNKPVAWTHEQHLENPGVNALDDHERRLFKACGDLVKNSRKPKNTNKD